MKTIVVVTLSILFCTSLMAQQFSFQVGGTPIGDRVWDMQKRAWWCHAHFVQ